MFVEKTACAVVHIPAMVWPRNDPLGDGFWSHSARELGGVTPKRSFSNRWKGKTMRMITILAPGVSLVAAVATGAQAQSTQAPAQAPAPPPAAAPEAPAAGAPAIKSVIVVDIQELPKDTQKQVNDVVKQRGEADLERLRASIDGMPELKSALEAKGLTSAQVIAASMGTDGALTLITKKAG